jgi:hypothetical protein
MKVATMTHQWRILLACYLLSGFLAFGHAAANTKVNTSHSLAAQNTERVFSGGFAALFNPFYWPWVAFEKKDT